ncbi:MAG: sensor histidine kinase, partial [Bacteroidetes bacterium]
MSRKRKISANTYLMAGSLGLLLVFIFLWLNRVYLDEYESLQRETDFLFVNTIRDLEDELFRKTGDKPVILKLTDTIGLSSIESTGRAITLIDSIVVSKFRKDTLMNSLESNPELPVFDHMSVKMVKRFDQRSGEFPDSNVTIRVQTLEGHQDNTNALNGSISFYMELETDSLSSDSAKLNATIDLLNDRIWKSIGDERLLPGNFNIIVLADSLEHLPPLKKLTSTHYHDMFSGDALAMEIPNFRLFIFRKMIPEFLFSLLLLGSIILAFFFINRSLQRQRKLTELKNDLISNISHELKTPITTVGVAIEALSNFDAQTDPERTKEYLDISKHELNRLSILVDKVLKMSLFEQKEPTLRPEPINLDELVGGILSSMKLQFEKHKAKVNVQSTQNGIRITGDRIHLTNVIYNLIENALKYNNSEPRVDITIEDL